MSTVLLVTWILGTGAVAGPLVSGAAKEVAPPTAASQEAPDAVVVRVTGAVHVEGAGGRRPAAVGQRLSKGDRVVPEGGGKAVLVYRTGATQEVSEPLTVEAMGGSGNSDMFARTVQVLAQAASSDARNQPNRQGMIRPVPGFPEIIAPRNHLAVLEVRPTFSWHPVEGATGYLLQIRKEGEAPVRYAVGEVTRWTLPDTLPALERGAVYWWTVGPVGRGRPSREMAFRVLGQDEHAALQRQLDALRAAGLDPEGPGAFLAAVLYREAGLLYSAAASLERLEAAGQPLGVEAYLLKGEILDALGDLEGAQKAFDQADRWIR